MKYILSILVLLTATVSLWAQTENKEQTDTSITIVITAPLIGNLSEIVWDNADTVNHEQFKPKTKVPKCVKINGVCWATRNVDAPGTFVKNPEDAGMFYQWNRNKGWTVTDTLTSWDRFESVGARWEKSNDPCPAGYRIPTVTEQEALVNANNTWTSNYNGTGIAGRIFGSGSKTVFLPAVGVCAGYSGTLYHTGTYGYYWSNTSVGYGSRSAYIVFFYNDSAYVSSSYRSEGHSVRCVSE